jgi:hypothetical protein
MIFLGEPSVKPEKKKVAPIKEPMKYIPKSGPALAQIKQKIGEICLSLTTDPQAAFKSKRNRRRCDDNSINAILPNNRRCNNGSI